MRCEGEKVCDVRFISLSVSCFPPQGDRCVPPEDCPCHHNGRLYFTNDTITKDCNTWYTLLCFTGRLC